VRICCCSRPSRLGGLPLRLIRQWPCELRTCFLPPVPKACSLTPSAPPRCLQLRRRAALLGQAGMAGMPPSLLPPSDISKLAKHGSLASPAPGCMLPASAYFVFYVCICSACKGQHGGRGKKWQLQLLKQNFGLPKISPFFCGLPKTR
jgi:hypothetical protein